MNSAVYPGSFDGFHRGHEAIIRSMAPEYDQLYVAVGDNSDKKTLFDTSRRVAHIKHIVGDLKNVLVTSFEGLTVDFCLEHNIPTIIRGLRDDEDLSFEKTQAWYNTFIEPGINIRFVACKLEYFHLSSSSLKTLIASGGTCTHTSSDTLVHPFVKSDIEKALMNQYFVGITGVPGSGKSHIAKKFSVYAKEEQLPLHHIDMDSLGKIIHDETSPYVHIRDTIATTFPDVKRTSQGGIVPASLMPLFGTPGIKQLLDIMRPAIFRELRKAIHKKQGIIMLESALFAEENLAHLVNNHLLVVTADEKTQQARLQQRPRNSAEQISKLLSSQYPAEKKYKILCQKRDQDNFGHIHLIDNSERNDPNNTQDKFLRTLFHQMVAESGMDS